MLSPFENLSHRYRDCQTPIDDRLRQVELKSLCKLCLKLFIHNFCRRANIKYPKCNCDHHPTICQPAQTMPKTLLNTSSTSTISNTAITKEEVFKTMRRQ